MKIKLYWCHRLVNGQRNFGDWISPELCQVLSGREVVYAGPKDADLVAVGSVLHRLPVHFWNRRLQVWGTGLMKPTRRTLSRHHYHAVRGRLTAECLPQTQVNVWGDPGLLVDLLLPDHAEIPKRWRIGLVPHHVDQTHPSVRSFLERWPEVRMLDVLGGTQPFLKELAGCRLVLSSSLHGLVAADAFGIPNAWVQISEGVRGGGFKFHDYYSAFGLNAIGALSLRDMDEALLETIQRDYQRTGLADIKRALLDSFPFRP